MENINYDEKERKKSFTIKNIPADDDDIKKCSFSPFCVSTILLHLMINAFCYCINFMEIKEILFCFISFVKKSNENEKIAREN